MIIVDHVVRRFGRLAAVNGADLTVADGEAVVIAGPSGSGKTTLLRLIAGLETPDEGCVFLDGAIASSPRFLLAPHLRDIGFAFQQPSLWPHMTVAANIGFPLGGWHRTVREERVAEMIEALDLASVASRRPAGISGGEARRAALARALAAKPKHLLLDEPLVNLPPEQRAGLLRYVLESAACWGSAVVLVTHDPAEASLAAAARVIRMEDGRLH